jgi:hypothetical protein
LKNVSLDSAITVALTRTAVISGVVRDGQGQPIRLAKVSAMARRRGKNGLTYKPVGAVVLTDDRGMYRLHGLLPGHYAIAAMPAGEEFAPEVFSPTWFPGSANADEAEFFELKAGEERTSTDITVPNSQRISITGKVLSASGEPDAKRAVIVLSSQTGPQVPIATVSADQDGLFRIPGVPPGDYRIAAMAPASNSEGAPPPPGAGSALRSFSAGSSDVDIQLQLRPLVSADGQFRFSAATGLNSACRKIREIELSPQEVWPFMWRPEIAVEDGRFRITGLPAGHYKALLHRDWGSCRITMRLGGEAGPGGGSPLVDGTAILVADVGGGEGEITGSVLMADGNAAKGMAFLIALDGEQVQYAWLDPDGSYRFSEVPASDYVVAATGNLGNLDYLDPMASQQKSVTLKSGEKIRVDLRLER